MNATEVELVEQSSDFDSVAHCTCTECYPNPTQPCISLCGVSQPGWIPGEPPDGDKCVVCADLFDKPCDKCGSY